MDTIRRFRMGLTSVQDTDLDSCFRRLDDSDDEDAHSNFEPALCKGPYNQVVSQSFILFES